MQIESLGSRVPLLCPPILPREINLCYSPLQCPNERASYNLFLKLQAVSHAENATIEAATREYGVDTKRIQVWRNCTYNTYRCTAHANRHPPNRGWFKNRTK